MDKNAIKKYAVWARRELIARVSQRAALYGITEQEIAADGDSINGHVLSSIEKQQRDALLKEIEDKGYEQVMEEVAYTWFNRFSALRFMEVNGYLPSHVRVFTDDDNAFKPQILAEAINMELDGLDLEKVYALKNDNDEEALFKYLIIIQCNALNKILPGMFQTLSDYTELLFPDNLLREGSVIQQMIEQIPEEDWQDAVQIIGWLYQYYNSEKKDDVFAALKKNVKITKENIPAATQLFTPDWIVRYMVENSLGRLWLEGHPDAKDQLLPTEEEQSAYAAGNRAPEDTKWHYYLEEAEQEPEVQAQLAEIRREYAALTPDQLKVIDPCSGSGHILAYMFDVLIQIYESYGYTTREAVASIVENNLYGLDIDDRAAQLAYFAVMMKAAEYDKRFLKRKDEDGNPNIPQSHVYAIAESNHVDKFAVDYFCNGDMKLTAAMDTIISELHDAKEYGSVLTVSPQDWSALYDRFAEITEDINMSRETVLKELLPLVQVAEALAQKYDTVVTNPPYMGSSGMSAKLLDFVKKNYPDSKSDMSTVCMEKTISMCKQNGYMAMINIPVWMFLTSYEKLRDTILQNNSITSMVHPGRGIFGSDFGTIAFAISKRKVYGYKGCYRRLFSKQGEVESPEVREQRFLECRGKFEADQENYFKIPGHPISYWVSTDLLTAFIKGKKLGEMADSKQGLATADNNRFLRLWYEVDIDKVTFSCENEEESSSGLYKWYPYNKGGEFRKWYGNNDYVVNWEYNGREIRNFTDDKGKLRSRPQNTQFYFRESFSWSLVTSSVAAFRYKPMGHIFDIAGMSCFSQTNLLYLLALCNTKVVMKILEIIAPTINYQCGDIANIPIIVTDKECKQNIEKKVESCINISRNDWDSFETSWDFKRSPLI